MPQFVRDLRFAGRGFRKAPIFTAVAILSLALGIGANTAIFTLIDQLILRLLPIQNPEQAVLLAGRGRHYGGNNGRNALSYPMYQDLRDQNQVFSGMMCRYRLYAQVNSAAQPEVVGAELVSGNYFPLLGVRPAAGRLFTSQDDLHAGAHPWAVLSYAYWQTRYSGDRSVIGRTIRFNDYPLTIVGVSQPGFEGMEPGIPAQMFVPMAMAQAVRPGFTDMFNRRQRWVNVYGRLKPGIAIRRAQAGLLPLFRQTINMEVLQPPFRHATPYDKQQFLRMWLEVMPGAQGNTNMRREYQTPLLVLMAVVGLVLLIACANLASLLTARAAARQKEIAVRLAIGASRGRMIRQLLTESLLLATAGGAIGILLALLMVKGLLALLPPSLSGYSISSTPDPRMLAFTFALTLATGVLFGLAPALQSTRPNLAGTLKDQAGGVIGGGHVGLRKILVAAQVSLSLLLLIGAGLFVRSLANLRGLDPGFRVGNLIQFQISPRSAGYTAERTSAFWLQLEERLRAIPGVYSAGLALVPVLANNEWDNSVTIAGYNARPGEDIDPHFNQVSAGYFDTLGIRVIAGRGFTLKDSLNAPRVAVVNASFARRYFNNARAVGHRIGQGSDPGTPTDIEIVGVVNDTRYENLREPVPLEYYLCSAQDRRSGDMTAYVRTMHDPDNAFSAVRAAVRDPDPNLPITRMKTLEHQLDESIVTERMIALLSSLFGALATALAIVGLYGVMAYMVTRRSREIGIRMALGADRPSVLWLIMREVLTLVAAGIAAGLPLAYLLTRLVQAQLYGVEAHDPAAAILATAVLLLVALAAGYIPARRAAGADPIRALRYE
ncbi:MAG: ABC transporter permease [Bryobacteraceae bacterium]